MNFPSFDDPFGKKKPGDRPPVKAPADLNWDAIEAKIRQRQRPAATGEPKYDSSGYLARMREEDPWPARDDKEAVKVSLSNCRFLNPDDLVPDESCTVACDVKILATPSSRSVVFRLQRQGAQNGGWEEAGSTATVDLASSAGDQTAQADLVLRSPRPTPELGTAVRFKVTAEHSEASAPAESPDTSVQMRNLCRYVGAPEITFRNDGACPTLDASGGLVHALAAAVGRLSVAPPAGQSPDTVVIAGFASSSGTPDHDKDLSKRRALAIKAILGRDSDAWGDLAADFTTQDIQQVLSGLASCFGWSCDPGAVDGADGPKTRAGVKAFQAECNARYSLGLKEDGICGPRTWKAAHRAICAQVSEAVGQDPTAEPSWPDVPWGYAEGEGVYACGSDFAAPTDSAEDRHAEICFFESNMEPRLSAPAPGAKATLADYPVEDPEKIKKVKLEGSAKKNPLVMHYEPEISRVCGKMVSRNFVVECADGVQMCVETDERRWILQLGNPISLQARDDDPDNFPAEDVVVEIQVNFDESASTSFQEGEKVFLEGYLSHGHSQFHHTEIQMALRGRIDLTTSESDV